jgi:hypothetical protein
MSGNASPIPYPLPPLHGRRESDVFPLALWERETGDSVLDSEYIFGIDKISLFSII